MKRTVLGDNLVKLALDEASESGPHEAAIAHVRQCSDEQFEELETEMDARRGRAARDARRRARDDERSDVDHRRDFDSSEANPPDRDELWRRARDGRARDSAVELGIRHAADAVSRTRVAHERAVKVATDRARESFDFDSLFVVPHPYRHHDG
jgi:hypothetical protein